MSSSGLGLAEASCADSTAVPSLPTTSCPACRSAMSRRRDCSLSASLSTALAFNCASCSSRSARAARSSIASRASLALSARASASSLSEAESFVSSDLLSSTVLAKLLSSAFIASSLTFEFDAIGRLVRVSLVPMAVAAAQSSRHLEEVRGNEVLRRKAGPVKSLAIDLSRDRAIIRLRNCWLFRCRALTGTRPCAAADPASSAPFGCAGFVGRGLRSPIGRTVCGHVAVFKDVGAPRALLELAAFRLEGAAAGAPPDERVSVLPQRVKVVVHLATWHAELRQVLHHCVPPAALRRHLVKRAFLGGFDGTSPCAAATAALHVRENARGHIERGGCRRVAYLFPCLVGVLVLVVIGVFVVKGVDSGRHQQPCLVVGARSAQLLRVTEHDELTKHTQHRLAHLEPRRVRVRQDGIEPRLFVGDRVAHSHQATRERAQPVRTRREIAYASLTQEGVVIGTRLPDGMPVGRPQAAGKAHANRDDRQLGVVAGDALAPVGAPAEVADHEEQLRSVLLAFVL
eukprot:scaffold34109_cov73-Phaeocystis_antarctica.AAC.2